MKAKMGRPTRGPGPMDAVTYRIPADLRAWIRAGAARSGVSEAEQIRRLLETQRDKEGAT